MALIQVFRRGAAGLPLVGRGAAGSEMKVVALVQVSEIY